MCGICGIVDGSPERHVDPDVVRRMSEAIVHRGPDDDGYYVEGAVGLAARRLAIIDLAGGHQPVENEDGSIRVVYNGEIYNHAELRSTLERAGHRFRSRSDTEVIVHAYEKDGPDFLHQLRGMFAFALWDSQERSLLLAVDRFGIKPLYYAANPERIVFGSELKCLLHSGLVAAELDFDALAEYFTFSYIPPPRTIFRDVRKLAPGTLLQWAEGREPLVRQWWELPTTLRTNGHHETETRTRLRAGLADAVRSHLVSDVPVGAFLSGGIDSSIVVALMSEVAGERIRTFSIGFSDPRYNELDKARIVANRFETDHHEFVLEPDSVDSLPEIVALFDEPFADASALPTYYVSKLARESVKVVLSGDGGDELFIGYPLFQSLQLARYAQKLPAAIRRAIAGGPRLLPTPKASWNDRVRLLAKRTGETLLPPTDAYRRKLTVTDTAVVGPLLSPELRDELDRRNPFRTLDYWLSRYASERTTHPLQQFLQAGVQFSLAGDMLVKVDRASMANSLEVRVPLLDHLLAEQVASIPVEQRMPRWRLKGLLKDVMRDALPESILRQPKRGFVVPLSAWFRGDLQSVALDVLTSSEARDRGFLDTDAVARAVREHQRGSASLGSVIWSLLVFELWCRSAPMS